MHCILMLSLQNFYPDTKTKIAAQFKNMVSFSSYQLVDFEALVHDNFQLFGAVDSYHQDVNVNVKLTTDDIKVFYGISNSMQQSIFVNCYFSYQLGDKVGSQIVDLIAGYGKDLTIIGCQFKLAQTSSSNINQLQEIQKINFQSSVIILEIDTLNSFSLGQFTELKIGLFSFEFKKNAEILQLVGLHCQTVNLKQVNLTIDSTLVQETLFVAEKNLQFLNTRFDLKIASQNESHFITGTPENIVHMNNVEIKSSSSGLINLMQNCGEITVESSKIDMTENMLETLTLVKRSTLTTLKNSAIKIIVKSVSKFYFLQNTISGIIEDSEINIVLTDGSSFLGLSTSEDEGSSLVIKNSNFPLNASNLVSFTLSTAKNVNTDGFKFIGMVNTSILFNLTQGQSLISKNPQYELSFFQRSIQVGDLHDDVKYLFGDDDFNGTYLYGDNITIKNVDRFGFFQQRSVYNNVKIEFQHINGTDGNLISIIHPDPTSSTLTGCIIKVKMGGSSKNSFFLSEDLVNSLSIMNSVIKLNTTYEKQLEYAPLAFKLNELNLENVSGFVSSDFQKNVQTHSSGLIHDANKVSIKKCPNLRITHVNNAKFGAALWFNNIPGSSISIVDSPLLIFFISLKVHGSTDSVPGYSDDFVKNGAVTEVSSLISKNGISYAFDEDFYHDFQVFTLQVTADIGANNYSLFLTDNRYMSYMNVTIKGNLVLTGTGSGGIFMMDMADSQLHVINTIINVPNILPSGYMLLAFGVSGSRLIVRNSASNITSTAYICSGLRVDSGTMSFLTTSLNNVDENMQNLQYVSDCQRLWNTPTKVVVTQENQMVDGFETSQVLFNDKSKNYNNTEIEFNLPVINGGWTYSLFGNFSLFYNIKTYGTITNANGGTMGILCYINNNPSLMFHNISVDVTIQGSNRNSSGIIHEATGNLVITHSFIKTTYSSSQAWMSNIINVMSGSNLTIYNCTVQSTMTVTENVQTANAALFCGRFTGTHLNITNNTAKSSVIKSSLSSGFVVSQIENINSRVIINKLWMNDCQLTQTSNAYSFGYLISKLLASQVTIANVEVQNGFFQQQSSAMNALIVAELLSQFVVLNYINISLQLTNFAYLHCFSNNYQKMIFATIQNVSCPRQKATISTLTYNNVGQTYPYIPQEGNDYKFGSIPLTVALKGSPLNVHSDISWTGDVEPGGNSIIALFEISQTVLFDVRFSGSIRYNTGGLCAFGGFLYLTSDTTSFTNCTQSIAVAYKSLTWKLCYSGFLHFSYHPVTYANCTYQGDFSNIGTGNGWGGRISAFTMDVWSDVKMFDCVGSGKLLDNNNTLIFGVGCAAFLVNRSAARPSSLLTLVRFQLTGEIKGTDINAYVLVAATDKEGKVVLKDVQSNFVFEPVARYTQLKNNETISLTIQGRTQLSVSCNQGDQYQLVQYECLPPGDYNGSYINYNLDSYESSWSWGLFSHTYNFFYNITVRGKVRKTCVYFSLFAGRISGEGQLLNVDCEVFVTVNIPKLAFIPNISASVSVSNSRFKLTSDRSTDFVCNLFWNTYAPVNVRVFVMNTSFDSFFPIAPNANANQYSGIIAGRLDVIELSVINVKFNSTTMVTNNVAGQIVGTTVNANTNCQIVNVSIGYANIIGGSGFPTGGLIGNFKGRILNITNVTGNMQISGGNSYAGILGKFDGVVTAYMTNISINWIRGPNTNCLFPDLGDATSVNTNVECKALVKQDQATVQVSSVLQHTVNWYSTAQVYEYCVKTPTNFTVYSVQNVKFGYVSGPKMAGIFDNQTLFPVILVDVTVDGSFVIASNQYSYTGGFFVATLTNTKFFGCTSSVKVTTDPNMRQLPHFGGFAYGVHQQTEFYNCTYSGSFEHVTTEESIVGGFVASVRSSQIMYDCVFNGSLTNGFNTGPFAAGVDNAELIASYVPPGHLRVVNAVLGDASFVKDLDYGDPSAVWLVKPQATFRSTGVALANGIKLVFACEGDCAPF